MAAVIWQVFALWLAPELSVWPQSVALNGPEAQQQLLAQAASESYQEDWTRAARWTSSNPGIAVVDAAGVVRPAGDGEAVISASVQGLAASTKVRVRNFGAAFTWSFRNHIIPVLTKAGCNSGACHGALAGKNGFKLTLRGYDPELDHDALTRQSLGRRVSLPEPANSLMLLKPTLAIPHGGGRRFEPGSLEYRIIAEWIAAGAPRPADSDPQVTVLEVFPSRAVLKTGAEQQLVVRAQYSDGEV
ncbi:MAG: hypothetical protein FJW37_14650, partial [Acidobacteria bacterium]|nr:hypothetical protein [Acidobacteriota bacterium]